MLYFVWENHFSIYVYSVAFYCIFMFSKCSIQYIKYYTVFQIALRGMGDSPGWKIMGNFAAGNFFMNWWESDEEWFWSRKTFSKLKTTFHRYWTSIEIIICMTCMYRVLKKKKKKVQGLKLLSQNIIICTTQNTLYYLSYIIMNCTTSMVNQ